MNTAADTFYNNTNKWHKELNALRLIVLDCGLFEDFKWKHPCYTINNKNIVIVHGFKDFFALLFFKGALLHDSKKILIQQTENVQEGRQIRFKNLEELISIEKTIKQYIFEAIEVEKSGIKLEPKSNTTQTFPEELISAFSQNSNLKKAFESLTPGRQRGYLLHFASAAQSKTRVSRIDNCTIKIMNGFGFNDCTCGLSKRMPNCDGSHKILKEK
jgi:uncharacterized protein YdeI (YjbR/CyaY-like superfamily)